MESITRKQLADQWLALSTEHLSAAYKGDLGQLQKTLLSQGVHDHSLDATEQEFAHSLLNQVAQGFAQPSALQYLLAAMLYYRADQLPLSYQEAMIPNWFVADYMKFMLAAPRFFKEIGEAHSYYCYLENFVNFLHSFIFDNPTSPSAQEIAWLFAQHANFLQLYFNDDNLCDLFSKRADIIEFSLKSHGLPIDYDCPPRSSHRRKIRLGILTRHFSPHTETFATLPLFEHLPAAHFEIILYVVTLHGNPLEDYCQNLVDKWVLLPPTLMAQVQTIRADDLDILLIGTNVAAVSHQVTLLAIHRLARLQVTCFNSPVTTGIKNIDYYIAGHLTEPTAASQYHYREQLVTLPGTGFCFSYAFEPYTATTQLTRKQFNFPEGTVIFISAANFFKLIPELREIWAQILAAVPNSVLVLMPFGPTWTNDYPVSPFIKTMRACFTRHGVDEQRVQFLPTLANRADVKEVLKCGDIYLDAFPYASTTSLIDALEVGLPTVVKTGDTLRARMGAAVLEALTVVGLTATTDEAYIRLAVTLAHDVPLRHAKHQEILRKMQSHPSFLDSQAFSAQMGQMLQRLFTDKFSYLDKRKQRNREKRARKKQ